MRLIPLTVLLALAVPASAIAQGPDHVAMSDYYQGVQKKMLEYQRKSLLAMADSMPERLYRDKVTPEQRDFAQQVHHAAGAVPGIAAQVMGNPAPMLPDTAEAFSSRAGLKKFVNASYDYAVKLLAGQTEAQRKATCSLFGTSMPCWQVWDELHHHTIWTEGQLVANFRKHGMAPPAFGFF
jgi:hypothetical protein